MGKVALLAEAGITRIPASVVDWVTQYRVQGHEFIVADTAGGDEKFHIVISATGAINQTTLYCMDKPKNNNFSIPVKKFITEFKEESESFIIYPEDNSKEPEEFTGVHKIEDIFVTDGYRTFRDKQIIEDCDMVILVTASAELNKRSQKIIQTAGFKGKPVNVVQV